MIGNKKNFVSALALVLAGGLFISSAKAADEVILFKIHDVQPIKNDDGHLVGCDYNATFYNRSNTVLKSANLDFVWFDDTVNELAQQEQKKDEQKNSRKNSSQNKKKTSNVNSSDSFSVSSSIELTNLGAFQQKTIHSKLSSDRCFLLIGDVSLTASNCQTEGEKSSTSGNKNCNALFQYVSPSNGEYYSEFKPISPDEEKLQQENQRVQQRNKINQAYGETLAQFKKVSEALSAIKGDVDPDAVEAAPEEETASSDKASSPTPSSADSAPVNDKKAEEDNLQDKLNQLFPEKNSEAVSDTVTTTTTATTTETVSTAEGK